MLNIYNQQPLAKGIPLPRPPSKSTHNQENKNPLLVFSKVKLRMSDKLPANFFDNAGTFKLPYDKTAMRRAISLPKLEHKPFIRETSNERMMNSNIFGNKPDFRKFGKIKMNNFMANEKKRLIL